MTITTTTLRVGHLMTADPVTVEADAPISRAEQLLTTYRVSGLPVLRGDVVCGVISQTDIVYGRTNAVIAPHWDQLQVRHVMTSPAVTVRTDCRIDDAARLMLERHIHRLVVVAQDDTPIGVITTSDLVRMLLERYDVEFN